MAISVRTLSASIAVPSPAAQAGDGRRAIVLIDEPASALALRALLTRIGFEASIMVSGRSAIRATSRPASFVLLDLDMTESDGIEICRTIRTVPTFRQTPIAMLASWVDEAIRTRSREAGVTMILAKPVRPAAILGALAPRLPLDSSGLAELTRLIGLERPARTL